MITVLGTDGKVFTYPSATSWKINPENRILYIYREPTHLERVASPYPWKGNMLREVASFRDWIAVDNQEKGKEVLD
jgi:hypothetical protein